MVLCVKAAMKDAQRVKKLLYERELFDNAYRHAKEEGFILYPVKRRFSMPGVTYVERELEEAPAKGGLKARLSGALTDGERASLTSSFDIVGSIAIVEIEPGLEAKERLIAEAILADNRNVKTVLKKAGGHVGELRVQKMAYLAGEDVRETIVVENGVRLKIDVEGVYYSVRSATERKRIASLVKPGERVLVMFSGAAPYCCVIAKRTDAAEIVGIELNEKGHELGVVNVKLNKLGNVALINDDVRNAVPLLAEKGIAFDRIVMPLPHTGHDFLDEAFSVAHAGTTIHLYGFEREGEFEKAAEKAEAAAARNKRAIKVLGITPSGQHSPRLYRVCVDFEVRESSSCAAKKR